MIYTQFSEEVKIIAYNGKHKTKWQNFPSMLVTISLNGENTYRFVSSLKADNGINEIHEAVDNAPEVTLSKKELKFAINEAE